MGLTWLPAIAMLSIAGIAKRHDALRTEGKKGKYVKVLESTFLSNKRQIN